MRSHLLFVLTCCCHADPKIASFHVTPASYCPSAHQTIHVDWQTDKGNATLQIDPDDRVPRAVPSSGTFDFAAHDSVVTLVVSAGELKPHVVQPIRAVDQHSLNALGQDCANDWVTAAPADFGGGSNVYPADAHPAVISNKCSPTASATATCHRTVEITHAGRTWELGPDAVLDITHDESPMSGPWTLRQKLLPGEVCATPSASSALEVDLNLELGCTKGAGYEQ